jgi:hypothetical protein
MLVADESLFFGRSDEFAVDKDCGCGVVPDGTSES